MKNVDQMCTSFDLTHLVDYVQCFKVQWPFNITDEQTDGWQPCQ